jgi:hypothetical protein
MAAADYIDGDTPLSQQPIWGDVTPAPSRGEQAVAIQHGEHDREVLQYFLAVAASGEKSLRALALTEAVRFEGSYLCPYGRFERYWEKAY